jgi:hypothetical protein
MEVCGSTTSPWFVRTKELKGRRIVSHPAEPDVVLELDDMIVVGGGTSDREGGMPLRYLSLAISGDSAASGDEDGER